MNNTLKTPDEILSPLRGKGNFHNCVDYDDAIRAMEEYRNQPVSPPVRSAEELLKIIKNDSYKHTDDLDETACPRKGAKYRLVVDFDDVERILKEYANQFKGTTPAIITDQAALLEILNNLWKHGYDSNRKDNFYVNDYKKGAIEDVIKLLSKQNPSTPAVQDTDKEC